MAEAKRTCPTCTLPFEARNGNQRYCTETCREVAKWKRTAKVPCSTCGRPTGYKLGSVEAATCNDCRRESIEHGTPTGYGKRVPMRRVQASYCSSTPRVPGQPTPCPHHYLL